MCGESRSREIDENGLWAIVTQAVNRKGYSGSPVTVSEYNSTIERTQWGYISDSVAN